MKRTGDEALKLQDWTKTNDFTTVDIARLGNEGRIRRVAKSSIFALPPFFYSFTNTQSCNFIQPKRVYNTLLTINKTVVS